ncbi:hypothetical protein ACWGIE_20195 [Pseudomonas fulva]
MTEVHRYKAVQLVSMGGSHIGYDPHGPDVVMASAYDELRAQLAKRDALLRKIEGYHWAKVEPEERARTRAELRDMLSASAVPSALATQYPNRLCHIDYTAHPHRCGCLKGDEEAQRRYDAHYRTAGTEPSTPVERDEEKAFDDWRKEQIASLHRMNCHDAATAFRNLGSVHWTGWQARAALERAEHNG